MLVKVLPDSPQHSLTTCTILAALIAAFCIKMIALTTAMYLKSIIFYERGNKHVTQRVLLLLHNDFMSNLFSLQNRKREKQRCVHSGFPITNTKKALEILNFI